MTNQELIAEATDRAYAMQDDAPEVSALIARLANALEGSMARLEECHKLRNGLIQAAASRGGTTVPATLADANPWAGAWNNWIAPFHACPRCGASLNWKQGEDVFDNPLVSAKCCGVSFMATMQWNAEKGSASSEPYPAVFAEHDAAKIDELVKDTLAGRIEGMTRDRLAQTLQGIAQRLRMYANSGKGTTPTLRAPEVRRKPTIDELEEILAQEGQNNVEILPSGEIVSRRAPEVTDTERLDWLVAEGERVDPVAAVVFKRNFDRSSNRWGNAGSADIRADIDAARGVTTVPTGRVDGGTE